MGAVYLFYHHMTGGVQPFHLVTFTDPISNIVEEGLIVSETSCGDHAPKGFRQVLHWLRYPEGIEGLVRIEQYPDRSRIEDVLSKHLVDPIEGYTENGR